MIQDNDIKPVLNEKPTYWRLTIPGSDTSESEELVWTIQGVIVNKDLPPVLNRYFMIISDLSQTDLPSVGSESMNDNRHLFVRVCS